MFFAIEEFIALGNTQNFSKAATQLGVSTSHVSRKINALEQKLGVRLVHRTTRVVRLTNAGYEYFQKCTRICDEMEEANATLLSASTELEGSIKISAAGDYSERFVAPCLARFGLNHPKLRIEMDFNPRNINLIDDGFDFAVRYGELSDSSMIARKLTERNIVAAASPQYLSKHGVPSHPHELAQHRGIVSVNNNWRFYDNNEAINVKIPVAWKSNSATSLLAAAVSGVGICYLPETTIAKALSTNELQAILTPFSLHSIPTWLVYPSQRFVPQRVRAAMDYLVEELS